MQEQNFVPTSEQEPKTEVPKESMEFLDSKLHEAENRKPNSEGQTIKLAEDGSHVARQEMEKMQKLAGTETAEPKVLSEVEKQQLMNQLLKPTEHAIFAADQDPFDAINNLLDKAA